MGEFLPGDHVGIVVGMHEGRGDLLLEARAGCSRCGGQQLHTIVADSKA